METVEIPIEGMHCHNCALGVERHLTKLGAHAVRVDLASSSARMKLPPTLSVEAVRDAIIGLGYRSPIARDIEHASHGVNTPLLSRFIFCAVFSAPLFLHMIVDWHPLHNSWVQLALCTPVWIVGALHFGKSALASLRARFANMDVLIFFGITTAYIYSLVGTLAQLGPDFLFYETSATLTTAVLLGNLIEERAVRRTTSAIEQLMLLQPTRARRVSTQDGSEQIEDVTVEQLVTGDTILVNLGDRIPTDGIVLTGSALLDESVVSGESIPQSRSVGSTVLAGSIVTQGSIHVTVSTPANTSTLANIVEMVRDAQTRRPAIQRIGDRVSAVFVPTVFALAVITFLGSLGFVGISPSAALMRSIAVLVIACPCAMGLATPTALMVAFGRAARHGILIRGGDTMESLAKIHTVVLDKTGTITTGRFGVQKIDILEGEREFALAGIKALEQHSSHPLAEALLDATSAATALHLSKVEETAGKGISAITETGERLFIGAAPDGDAGGYDLVLTHNDRSIAGIQIRDQAKPETVDVIAELARAGIKTVLLSGDRSERVTELAKAVGIAEAHGKKSPAEKLAMIELLSQDGGVAFVGDGINDAPALSRATVGISLSNATAVAIQSAQVILLGGDLRRLTSALQIAQTTMQTIRQNLFWALFYNVLAVPVAMAGLLNPVIAALAMSCSDVVVIGNSLRLRKRALQFIDPTRSHIS